MEKTIISPDIRGKTLLFIKTTYYGNNQTKQNKPTAPKKELSDIFLAETRKTHGIIISVSVVRVSPDLSTAKAYLSIFPPEKSAEMIENINANTKTIRYELSQRVRYQLRKTPELSFFLDDSLDYIENIDSLLKKSKRSL